MFGRGFNSLQLHNKLKGTIKSLLDREISAGFLFFCVKQNDFRKNSEKRTTYKKFLGKS